MNIKLIKDNREFYESIIRDIISAKKSIYLETYIFDRDETCKKIRDILTRKAKNGLDVRLLYDYFGSEADMKFFACLKKAKGLVRPFRKFVLKPGAFIRNNQRDHRKLLVIDKKITYLGSTNITKSNINWRDTNIRIKGKISKEFEGIFLDNFLLARKYFFDKKAHNYPIRTKNLEIYRDVPSLRYRRIRNRIIREIDSAKTEILIETPYFLPDHKLRHSLRDAAARGVDVHIILPLQSDVKAVDILRENYLGSLYRSGVRIHYYKPQVLHSKLLIIDRKKIGIGSANLDYRSSVLQFELFVFSKDKKLCREVLAYYKENMLRCSTFVYSLWKTRPLISKIIEKILWSVRYLL